MRHSVVISRKNPVAIYANGELLNLKKGRAEFDAYDMVVIRLVYHSEFSQKHWARNAFLFWIAGIAGIFTPKYPKQTDALDYRIQLQPSEPLDLRLNVLPKNDSQTNRAVFHNASIPFYEVGAAYQQDPVAAKRRKRYLRLARLGRFAILAAAAAVVLLSIL